jgi:hypothetical protein
MDSLIFWLISILVLLGLAYDNASMLLKGLVVNSSARELVAFSGLVQYVSRILFLAATFIMVFSFESSKFEGISSVEVGLLTLVSCLFTLPLVSLRKIWIVGLLSSPINYFFFSGLKLNYRNLILEGKIGVNALGWRLVGLTMQVLMLTAIFLPIIIAQYIPDFRMSLAFIGQALNFSFTILIMALVEPNLFRAIDKVIQVRVGSGISQHGIASEVLYVAEGKVCGTLLWSLVLLFAFY